MFEVQIAKELQEILQQNTALDSEGVLEHLPDKENCSISHLIWMCEQIQTHNTKWTEDKINRWLGFIQGVMCMRELTTVDIERVRVANKKEGHVNDVMRGRH